MELKVLRSHDYGNVLNSDRNSNYYHKFYFSFFASGSNLGKEMS